MIVSWNWLKQYVLLDMSAEELARRLMMAGLNHESTEEVGGDLAIDLEVTSNRPDCLGHLGIARETAVLFNKELKYPAAQPKEGKTPVDSLVKVRIDCLDLCPRYTARVIRGVKIAPSPKWLASRLETVGITPINNVVDVSNYVLMECGQPLHTFDYGPLVGHEIIVRRPKPNETIEAIDHKTYALSPEMCVIADAERAVAIGGVMGGAATEISEATVDVLIEAAEFNPLSIRSTARKLNLHSDSSYRFERKIDPEGVEWASRRCCELILETAGGELAAGLVDVGQKPLPREPVTLRFSQLQRILGIEVPPEDVQRILIALGNAENAAGGKFPATVAIEVVPPSWRRDLTREIDLIEEVARIYGYEKIPEDVSVPMAPSAKRKEDRIVEKIRTALVGSGFDEAMTLSAVDRDTALAFSPWTDAQPLQSSMPVIRGADYLRRSLVPSLLQTRRTNESLSNPEIELFEIAKVYLPQTQKLPDERIMLGMTSGRSFGEVKGTIEAILAALKIDLPLSAVDVQLPLLDDAESCCLKLGDTTLGFLGKVSASGLKQFELRGRTTVAEIQLSALYNLVNLVPQYVPLPPYPAVSRDINLVLDESIRWEEIATTVKANGGPMCEKLDYCDTYRDAKRLGEGRKSFLMSVVLRSKEGTLTSQEADDIRDRIVEACRKNHRAELRTN